MVEARLRLAGGELVVADCRNDAQALHAPDQLFQAVLVVIGRRSAVPRQVAVQQDRVRMFPRDPHDEFVSRGRIGRNCSRWVRKTQVAIRDPVSPRGGDTCAVVNVTTDARTRYKHIVRPLCMRCEGSYRLLFTAL